MVPELNENKQLELGRSDPFLRHSPVQRVPAGDARQAPGLRVPGAHRDPVEREQLFRFIVNTFRATSESVFTFLE